MKQLTIKDLKENNMILIEGVVGSHSYGLNIDKSDVDKKGVFIQHPDDILSFGYIEQINDTKNDTTYYEIRRFLELVATDNPNILELLFLPEDMITYKHPIWDLVIEHRMKFLTKNARNSFGGYAIAQIKKARGLNKNIVNPQPKERKTPLDFCYLVVGEKSYPLKEAIDENNYDQKFFGVTNIPHAHDLYALFYDLGADQIFNEKRPKVARKAFKSVAKILNRTVGLGYKGIEVDSSNTIRLSSIPKGEECLGLMTYNKDAYTVHCKDHKKYWNWVENRNEARYSETANHGKGYDAKNMLHCHRLLDMAQEIAEGKGVVVRRPNREELLEIRRGNCDYDQLIQVAEEKISKIDEIFKNSDLPDKVDRSFVNDLLLKIRKEFDYDSKKPDFQMSSTVAKLEEKYIQEKAEELK